MARQRKAMLAVLCIIMVFAVFSLSNGQQPLSTTTATETYVQTTVPSDETTSQDQLRQLLLARKQILARIVATMETKLKYGNGSLSAYSQAKKAALLADIDLCDTQAERIEIYKEIVRWYTELLSQMEKEVNAGQRPQESLDEIRVAQLDAEIRLLKEQLPTEPSSRTNAYGRYQLVVSTEGSHAFVIDNVTGQVWSRYPGAVSEKKEFLLPKVNQ